MMGELMDQILVVDDCGVTRKLLTFMIKGGGYNIILAGNGVEGLEKLASSHVDLIVTDLNMPLMDGLEFAVNVRSAKEYRHIPIIMLTTEAGAEDRARADEAGISHYFVKPVEPEALMDEIKKLIN